MELLSRRMRVGLVSVLGFGIAATSGYCSMNWEQARQYQHADSEAERALSDARALIAGWPEASRLVAGRLLDKYGAPDSVLAGAISWAGRGDWLRIEVDREEPSARRGGIVEHAVRYEVSVAHWSEVTRLGLGLRYEPIGMILSAASASEESNILALNLAVDVIEGRRNVEEAREFHRRTMDLTSSGKWSPYTRGLMFRPPRHSRNRRPGQLWPMP